MPLVAFMKQSDPNRVSTITSNVEDRSRSRKIREPLGENVYANVYVVDCKTHIGGVSVPVELRDLQRGGGWVVRGVARCCPICWRVVVGVDGEKDPPVKPVPVEEKEAVSHRRVRQPKPDKRLVQKTTDEPVLSRPVIAKWAADKTDGFTIYDVMQQFNVGRSTASVFLGTGIRFGWYSAKVGAGRGQKTIYKIIQQEKA